MSTDAGGRAEREARAQVLLAELGDPGLGDSSRVAAREELVTMHLDLVRALAAKYRDRGEPLDDLVQVGTIGLMAAIDRYDPAKGSPFGSFASSTIIFEIKQYFRQETWALTLPRTLKDRALSVSRAIEELTMTSGRSPTVREVSEVLGLSEEAVLEAMDAGRARHALPMDPAPTAELGGTAEISALDDAVESLADREAVRDVLAGLSERDRLIVARRYFDDWSQSAIAQEAGISQMHVSRILDLVRDRVRAAAA
jgi:RNA polymerase sigma-B factor